MTPFLDVADWAAPVDGLGPGRRLILWVRGCPLACAGCMTPEFWDAGDVSTHRPIAEIAALLAPSLLELDGLTISGGEPTLQSAALTVLIRTLRAHPGLGALEVLSYSGFTWEELQTRGDDVAAYLSELDILIDGRFDHLAGNTRQWRGSDNQRVHLLSPRAAKYEIEADGEMPDVRPLQLQMLGAARFRLIGIPKRGDLAAYRAAMGEVGVKVKVDMPEKESRKSSS